MKYARILLAVASEIWAMHPDKLAAMIDFLRLQAAGEKFSAEQIEARIAPNTASAVARREGTVAILPVRGLISARMSLMNDISGGTSAEQLGQAFDGLVADDMVKAVILDVDSPGGSAMLMDELSAKIAAARGKKTIVAQINPTAASAAYWIASAAEDIAITPSGWVGSIGAMAAHEDISKMLDEVGIARSVFTSSPFKNEQAEHHPLSEDAKAHIQAMVNTVGTMFEQRIATNRGVDLDMVRTNYGQGRMVLARQAVAQGMADRVATLDETLARYGAGPEARRPFAREREKRALALN